MHDEHCHCGHHHHHHHEAIQIESGDKARLKLKYMAEHNESHVKELEELSGFFEGEMKQVIDEAVALYREANEKLAKALSIEA
ncbi:hypothetical protein [Guggenheimella bovis]